MGETQVFWDSKPGGDLRVIVDVCEPKRGVVRSIWTESFHRAADEEFVSEESNR